MIWAMDGEAIADSLKMTRQAVSQSLKRGMRKCYVFVRTTWPDLGPLASSIFLMKYLDRVGNIEFDDNEVKKFNRLFPSDIRREIEDDIKVLRGKSYYTILEQVNEIFDRAYFDKELYAHENSYIPIKEN